MSRFQGNGEPDSTWLAATRAAAEAESRLSEGDAREALARARAGLQRLGPDYAPEGVKDDTKMYLRLAEEHERAGRLDQAARTTIDMLRTRIDLFARAHPERAGGA